MERAALELWERWFEPPDLRGLDYQTVLDTLYKTVGLLGGSAEEIGVTAAVYLGVLEDEEVRAKKERELVEG